LDADPWRDARAPYRPAGENRLLARGVVRRTRPPAPREDLDGAPRDARRPARQRAREDPARRRRLRVQLRGGLLERSLLRLRAVQGRERADRVDLRLLEQSPVRRDAWLRRR